MLNLGGAITGGAAGNTILTLSGSNTGANTISGAIGNGTATTVALFKSGAGTWVLSGNNTFTGGVTIDGGTLRVGSPGAFNANIRRDLHQYHHGNFHVERHQHHDWRIERRDGHGLRHQRLHDLRRNADRQLRRHVRLIQPACWPTAALRPLNLTLSSAAGGDLTLSNANTFSGVTNITGGGTIILGNANALQNSTLNVTVAGNSVQFPAGLTPFTLGGLSGPAGLVLAGHRCRGHYA